MRERRGASTGFGAAAAAAAAAALAVFAAVAGIALAACGSPTGNGTTSPPGQSPSLSAASGSGCGQSASAGSVTYGLEVDGHARSVIVHVPAGYSPTTKRALILNLHGSGSTAAEQEAFSGMDSASDRYGFIVAYPQAAISASPGYDWNVPNEPLVSGAYPPAGSADDVGFLVQLVHRLEARYCIDPTRVYATGVSGGGRMSSQLACDASSTFAAVAPVAGIRFPSPCPSTRPVPIVAFHGTIDPIDPYDGHGLAYWTYSVPTAAQRWASHDGCKTTPTVSHNSGYTLTIFSGCDSSATVELYSITNEGHEWPGGPPVGRRITAFLGPQSDAVNANAAMWAFFEAHPSSD